MRDPFVGYDARLERPYQDMMEESERFYDFCEEFDLDPEDPEAQTRYEQYCEDVAEEMAEAMWEAEMERRADEAMWEREIW